MACTEQYPQYSRPERIADAAVHVVGLAFATVGTTLLILWASNHPHSALITGVYIYGAALIGSFLASACYHFTPWEGPRHMLQRIDHAAIYLKIAGSYTPFVILIGSAFAYGVLALIWGLAMIGALAKLFFWRGQSHWGTLFYLGLGWIGVALMTSLLPHLPLTAIIFLVAGGLIYSAGAAVFSLDRLKYQNAIWHGFVLAASVCIFTAIALGVTA